MTTQPSKGLTYDDLQRMFPEEDLVGRELIDGELFVTPAPGYRHQRAVSLLDHRLRTYAEERGGEVLPGPFDVLLSDVTVLEPDVLFVRSGRVRLIEERYLREPPDLVVEVSSPSTRTRDRTRKREAYERFGVPEYWFVDLGADRIEVHRLEGGRYGEPLVLERGEALSSPQLPGVSVPVDDVLGPPAGG